MALSHPQVPAIKSILPGDQWPPGRMLGTPATQVELVASLPLMALLALRGWHRYRARRGASVRHTRHAWRDSLTGEIFFGQATPA